MRGCSSSAPPSSRRRAARPCACSSICSSATPRCAICARNPPFSIVCFARHDGPVRAFSRSEDAMKLSQSQLDQYQRDGFLIFPELFGADEVAILRREVDRLTRIEHDAVVREGAARAPKSMFRMHEADGATASPAFRALARSPRALAVAQQVLGDDDLYLHHSKVNVKTAIEGSVWPWHQDYGSWMRDGIQAPDLATFMVGLDDATEMNGCLYFLPGSHRDGRALPYFDTSTAYKL